ncbi:MAG TPA: zinc ABC transporter substrate-binding protein [Flavobacteriaceae bacterium]|nr:zinc ABC transporter substrate-binding protein [Flavobacteriaceae bacterium]
MKKISYIFSFILAGLILISCQDKAPDKKPKKVQVISSFSILTDILYEIGKDSIEVHNLAPVGTDPHEYEPVPEDIKFATNADLFVQNGMHLEGGDNGWFSKLTKSVNADKNRIVKASENVEPIYLIGEGKIKNEEVNPHSFISPVVGIEMAKTIGESLIAVDPDNKEFYQKNMEDYLAKLKEVEAEYREKFASIPQENRYFMASEQAFQYLVQEYGLQEGFIWAVDTEENGTPDQIKNAIAFVKKYNPPVLFVESNVDSRPMETVSKETGVPIYYPAIYSDELGKPGEVADTYLTYLQYNLKHIYDGLMRDRKVETKD